MTKKMLIKFGIMIIGLIILNEVVKHMPNLVEALYNSVFGIWGFGSFIVVLLLLIFEIIVVRRVTVDRRKLHMVEILIASIVGFFFLFCGKETVRESYDDILPERSRDLVYEIDFAEQLHPQEMVCLLREGEKSQNYRMQIWIFFEYYFADKNLKISKEFDEEIESNLLQYITSVSVAPEAVEWVDTIYSQNNSLDEILRYPHAMMWDTFFVIDDHWKMTNSLVMLRIENQNVVCSEELVREIYNGNSFSNYDENTDPYSILIERTESQYNAYYIKHIFVLCLLLILGLVITITLWGDRIPVLSVFMGLPIGVAEWVGVATVFILLGIRYSFFSMLILLIVLNGGIIWLNRKKYRHLDWYKIYNWIMLLIVVIILFVYFKISYCAYDSTVKCAMGYRLAKYGTLQDILAYSAPYGMLEPVIMSIGYLLGCDYVYAFYPVMMVCGMGIMFAANYYVYKVTNDIIPTIILAIGSILLITNEDFLLSAFYVMAHGPVAVYTLLLVVFVVLGKQLGIKYYNIALFLASTIVVLSRVEGAIYVLFVLVSSIVLEDKVFDLRKVVVGVSLCTIVWNVGQIIYIGSSADPLFWTPSRGILLIIGSLLAIIVEFAMKIDNLVIRYLKKHLNYILFICIISITLVASVLINRNMALINLPVFLSHFSNNAAADTNAAAFWAYIILLVPGIYMVKNKNMRIYSLSIIAGNILLIYFICLFRDGMPIRFGFYDSARRTIMQFLPMTLWLIVNCYYNYRNNLSKNNLY